ncbi:SDR family NAD(P)-dependent oxidoreductase [Sphingobium sp. R-21]|uniref:SDR family NAD(P)-dependent oxidoreductase n=1 Tax=Sphingobium sp. R-21 TaxID=3404056 RepID=UPI003CF752C7
MTNAVQKSAIVFGGSGGLGAGCVRALSREWPAVGIVYHNSLERAQVIAADISATCRGYPVRCDTTDANSVRAAIEEVAEICGPIGCAVYSAGCAIDQPHIAQITEEQWRDVFEAETLGFARMISVVLPMMREGGGGSLVAVTSMANRRVIPGDSISAAPKAAIEALCKGIAKEEGKFGIRANTVAPGAMDAGMGAQYIAERLTHEFWEGFRKSIPARRFGTAEDIGEAVAFFASDRSSYFTGQTLIADGGYTL